LGVDNGVVDLRTGKVRAEQREDRITKHSPVPFDPNATCPRFDQFISQVFGSDESLMRFMNKAMGYSL
jgi:putative DNA primase/helicase